MLYLFCPSHTIVGLTELIIADNGQISTKSNDTFDYERQTSVIVQIKATDTLKTYEGEKLNTAFAQLIINVIDVNDETPDIRMVLNMYIDGTINILQQKPQIFCF